MRIGAIDIGTNSVRLLIAEKQEEKLDRLVERIEVPRLGADINQTGYLKEAAIERTIKVLVEYKKLIDEFRAVPCAVATSAVREASNQQVFIDQVQQKTDIKIKPIPGKKEAYLSYLGVVSELSDLAGKMLVIDIGGGSTELISGESEDLLTYDSINLGAVRLKEEFGEDIKQLQNRVQTKFNFLRTGFNQLVGVGGTITTLAAINQKLKAYDRTKVQGTELTKEDIKQILSQLSNLSLSARKEVAGLGARRADIIIPGTVILLGIMKQIGLEKIVVSDAGLLEGIVYENI